MTATYMRYRIMIRPSIQPNYAYLHDRSTDQYVLFQRLNLKCDQSSG
jgi:hypothetical protein